jgi:hypothetical protein
MRKRTYTALLKRAAQRSYARVRFPSGLVLQGRLEMAVSEADTVKLVVGAGFRQGWNVMLRPRLAEMVKVSYA